MKYLIYLFLLLCLSSFMFGYLSEDTTYHDYEQPTFDLEITEFMIVDCNSDNCMYEEQIIWFNIEPEPIIESHRCNQEGWNKYLIQQLICIVFER